MNVLKCIPPPLRKLIRRQARKAGVDYASVAPLESRAAFAYDHVTARGNMPWRVRKYQVASLESRSVRKANCCARDVGKTSEIVITACWASICMPEGIGLVTAPLDNMLQPVMHEIRRQCETSPGLSANLEGSTMSPSWRLRFKNGFTLHGRIGGLAGLNYKGVHADWVWVDEAQDMPQAAWRELYPAVNPGGKLWVYGVPNGLRGDFFRHVKDPAWETHNWPMWLNPDVTTSDLLRLERVFGGTSAPAYVHNVAGTFCSGSALAFPIELVTESMEPYVLASYDASAGTFDRDILSHDFGLCYMGVDLGFAEDPTEVSVLHEDKDGNLHTVARAHIGHAPYDELAQILGAMIRAWEPAAVGIDAGGSGLAVVHLMAGQHTGRMIYPIFFNAWVTWTPDELMGGIRGYLKNLVTDAMAAEMASGALLFSRSDAERFEQYGNHLVQETATGRVTYSKGHDHIIDADRCAFYAARSHLFSASAEPTFTGIRVDTFGALPGDYGGSFPLHESL